MLPGRLPSALLARAALCSAAVALLCLTVPPVPVAPAAAHSIEIGAYVGADPPTADAINSFEELAGRHLASAAWYAGWDSASQPPFPAADLRPLLSHDGFRAPVVLHLTWEPWAPLADIAAGAYDGYISAYAGSAADWGGPIRLRFAHEMIQDNVHDDCQGQPGCPEWYPWQDQPADYVAAFRRVHDLFQAAGAANVAFVWCPNNYPFDLSVVRAYYPGAGYVDWLCVDGYNWTNQDGAPGWPDWQWFDDIYYNIYHTLADHAEIFGERPIMIGELASCEAGPYEQPGQTKAAWIENAFSRMKSADYARLQAFYWFQTHKECNWRVDSSPASEAAFRLALSDAIFAGHAVPAAVTYLPIVAE
jgi:hypothetical protein